MSDAAAILAKAERWVEELGRHGQVDQAGTDRLRETLADSFGERLDHQDDPLLVVMLCGPTAVGKSSLINALAGADISRQGLGATTRAAVLYVHERDDPARLFEYSHLLASNDQQETALVRHGRDELLHKVLVDTPDIDSVRLQHRELTARLVHAADVVLFVTSPEKYKVMRSARWIVEQRQQRAIAFVLNKWDRAALGLQHDQRQNVAEDFRHVLAGEGFSDPLIFKVSALAEIRTDPTSSAIENDLPALRGWLETGLTQSTASVIRQRRLRAAWGRLAAAIEPVVPRPLSSHPLLPEIVERLAASGSAAQQGVVGEATLYEAAGLEDSAWPSTPGLLGMWTRTRHRLAALTTTWRTGLSLFNLPTRVGFLPDGSGERSMPGHAFGAKSVDVLVETVRHLVREAVSAGIALGPVSADWTADNLRLERALALLPLDVATELVTQASRPTFRRVVGIATIYGIEALIVAVLLIAVGRVGIDFVSGNYAPGGLFLTVLELVSILLVIGNIVASMFFPPLRQRMRRKLAQQARSFVEAAVRRAQTALSDHVRAVDQLAHDGRDLLALIDQIVIALSTQDGDAAGINRLFGQNEPQVRLITQTVPLPAPAEQQPKEPVRRRPSFY